MPAFLYALKISWYHTPVVLHYSSVVDSHQQVRIIDAGRGHPTPAKTWGGYSPRWSAADSEGGHRNPFPGQPSLFAPLDTALDSAPAGIRFESCRGFVERVAEPTVGTVEHVEPAMRPFGLAHSRENTAPNFASCSKIATCTLNR